MKKLLISAVLALLTSASLAQLSFTGSDLTEDFNTFTAMGPNGGLDANTWMFAGFSSSSDLMSGEAMPPEFSGGIYSLPIPFIPGDFAIYFQGSGSDFTPGSATLVITNNSPGLMENINVAYDILEYNDQERSNSFNLQYSTDGINFTEVDVYLTTEASVKGPMLVTTPKSIALTGVSVPVGQNIYIRWFSDDVSGIGGRDEIGLDNVVISATTVDEIPTMGQWSLFILALLMSSMSLIFIYSNRRVVA